MGLERIYWNKEEKKFTLQSGVPVKAKPIGEPTTIRGLLVVVQNLERKGREYKANAFAYGEPQGAKDVIVPLQFYRI